MEQLASQSYARPYPRFVCLLLTEGEENYSLAYYLVELLTSSLLPKMTSERIWLSSKFEELRCDVLFL